MQEFSNLSQALYNNQLATQLAPFNQDISYFTIHLIIFLIFQDGDLFCQPRLSWRGRHPGLVYALKSPSCYIQSCYIPHSWIAVSRHPTTLLAGKPSILVLATWYLVLNDPSDCVIHLIPWAPSHML